MKIGAYECASASTEEQAVKEAELCLASIKGKDFDLPIVYDMETNWTLYANYYENRNHPETLENYRLTKDQITDNCLMFCRTIEAAGYQPMIYASYNYFYDHLDLDRISHIDLWLADYDQTTDFPRYSFRQYTSKGVVDGATYLDCRPGREFLIDLDIAYEDYYKIQDDMKALLMTGK